MAGIEKRPYEAAERRVDTKTREIVELMIIELRRPGIIEKQIDGFLVRRQKRAERLTDGWRHPQLQP